MPSFPPTNGAAARLLHKRGRYQLYLHEIDADRRRRAEAAAAASQAPVGDFRAFNYWLGNPLNTAKQPVARILDWHVDVRDQIRRHRHTIINKFAGAAMTEMVSRVMLEMMLTDHDPARERLAQYAFVTGVRMNLTQHEMETRILPMLTNKHPDLVTSYSKTEAKIELANGRYIKGYPTQNIDSARGQDDINFWFIDEAAFFPQTDQEKVYNVVSRYELKTDPWIVWNSTPDGKTGNFYELWEASKRGENDYHRVELMYQLGLGTLVSEAHVERVRRESPRMFRQEFCCEFIAPQGAVMPDVHKSDTVKEIEM